MDLLHCTLDFCMEFLSQARLVTNVFARAESASSVPTTINAHRSCRIRDRRRLQRCGCLLSQGKGICAGVVLN